MINLKIYKNKLVNLNKVNMKNENETKDFNLDELKSYKSCELYMKNLQKLSEKVEQTGLNSLIPLSNKIIGFHGEVKKYCDDNDFKVSDYFNLNSIRQKLYKLVSYPQLKDADAKPIRNYVFENAVLFLKHL